MGFLRLFPACSVVNNHATSFEFPMLPADAAVQMFYVISGFFLAMGFFASAHSAEFTVTQLTLKEGLLRLQAGDTLLLKAGEYRASIDLRGKPWSALKPTTIRSVSGEKAVIKGSDIVTGWETTGGGSHAHAWSIEPAQVIVDGMPLKQLGGTVFDGYPFNRASAYQGVFGENGGIWPGRIEYAYGPMPDQSFFFDRERSQLLIRIGGNPSERKIEVSVRNRLLIAENMHGLVVQDLAFEHSNTSQVSRGAAISVVGNDNTLRNITVRYADLTGIQMIGDRNQLMDSSVQFCGQLGVSASGMNNRIVRVDASFNNTRGFNKYWEAGGFKFVGNGGLQASETIGNRAVANSGDGIWFDWKNDKNIIRNNIAAYNTGFGIHYEVSRNATIQDNYVFGNGQRGIYISDSSGSWITHNLVVANGLEGIVAVGSGRKDNAGATFGAGGNKVFSNLIAWNKGVALILPKEAEDAAVADGNVYLGQGAVAHFSLGYPSPVSPMANSLAEWQRKTGEESHSVSVEWPMPNAIADALKQRLPDIDWSMVLRYAASLRNKDAAFQGNMMLPGGKPELVGPRDR